MSNPQRCRRSAAEISRTPRHWLALSSELSVFSAASRGSGALLAVADHGPDCAAPLQTRLQSPAPLFCIPPARLLVLGPGNLLASPVLMPPRCRWCEARRSWRSRWTMRQPSRPPCCIDASPQRAVAGTRLSMHLLSDRTMPCAVSSKFPAITQLSGN
jgi:hypothetical protein